MIQENYVYKNSIIGLSTDLKYIKVCLSMGYNIYYKKKKNSNDNIVVCIVLLNSQNINSQFSDSNKTNVLSILHNLSLCSEELSQKIHQNLINTHGYYYMFSTIGCKLEWLDE